MKKLIVNYLIVLGIGLLIGFGLRKCQNETPSQSPPQIQYEYIYKYSTDTLYMCDTVKVVTPNVTPSNVPPTENVTNVTNVTTNKTYVYTNSTDSVEYQIQVNSTVQPNWVKMDFQLRDKFKIINELDQIKIETDYGQVTNVTIKKDKCNKFKFYPTVGLGYGLLTNKIDCYIGVGLTYTF
jgi:hypothetical protein